MRQHGLAYLDCCNTGSDVETWRRELKGYKVRDTFIQHKWPLVIFFLGEFWPVAREEGFDASCAAGQQFCG